MKNSSVKSNRWPYVLAALVILTTVFFFSSRERLVDSDEGPYLFAAKLVMEGKSLYTDFFWPQMPLLPYAYGIWMKIFGANWHAARYFSGFLGGAMGLLLFFHVVRLTGKQTGGLLAVLLFAFSSFSIGWFSTTKTYPLSTFLLFAAYLSLFADRLKEWKYLMTGVFLGLAISTRLYFIGLVPVFFWLIHRQKGEMENRRALFLKYSAGLLTGLAPTFFFLFKNPDNFYFDNVGYHFLRSPYGLGDSIGQKFSALFRLVGFEQTEGFVGLQTALLFLAGAHFFYGHFRDKKKLPASALLTIFLIPLLFIPTPTHLQYFSALVPFLVLQAVLTFFQAAKNRKQRKLPAGPLLRTSALFFLGYAAMGAADFYEYTHSGLKVPGVRVGPEHAVNWKIETIQTVTRAVDATIRAAGEPVLAFWPGYLLESKAAGLPKMENQSNVLIAARLDGSEREKYRIISPDEILGKIGGREVRLILLESWTGEPTRSRLLALMRESGYFLAATVGGREIYKRDENRRPAPPGENR